MKSPPEKILFKTAEQQLGYFTAKQAIAAGYSAKNHGYHIKQGHWIREYRGIFRLANFPYSHEGQYVLWSLWSRGRDDTPQGVYSHETALSLYDVSDAMPAKLYMTVPKSFKKSVRPPKILVLHSANFSKEDILWKQGYGVTTPFRTIVDLATTDSTDDGILQQALHEFRNRGMLIEKQIVKLVEAHPTLAKFVISPPPGRLA